VGWIRPSLLFKIRRAVPLRRGADARRGNLLREATKITLELRSNPRGDFEPRLTTCFRFHAGSPPNEYKLETLLGVSIEFLRGVRGGRLSDVASYPAVYLKYCAACKAVYAGSIPTPASNISLARRNDARGPRESGAAPRL
jgi:hypothetical protein